MKLSLRKFGTQGHAHLIMPVLAIIVVAGVGYATLSNSHAAAPIAQWSGVLEMNTASSGSCLTSSGSTNGSKVVLNLCSTTVSSNQQWSVHNVKTATVMGVTGVQEFYVQNGAGSVECLNNPYGSKKNGTAMQLYACNPTDNNSLWVWGAKFTAQGLSAHQLVSVGSISGTAGKCIDDAYGYTTANNKVQTWACKNTGQSNQNWFEASAPNGSTGGGSGVTFNTCTSPKYTLPANASNPQDGITLSNYYVDTDTWNFAGYPGSQQTMSVCDYNNWYAMVNVNNNKNDGAVKTYPDVHEDFNSPKISTFKTVSSTYAHTAPSSGDWDYAYDIWINGVASSGSTELMVWTQSAGKQAHVPGIPTVASTTLGGISYNIHKSGSYVAYDMPTTKTSGTLDLLQIFNDMISRGYIPSTSTLGAIDYGVEVCNTNSVNTKFAVNNFSVTTN